MLSRNIRLLGSLDHSVASRQSRNVKVCTHILFLNLHILASSASCWRFNCAPTALRYFLRWGD